MSMATEVIQNDLKSKGYRPKSFLFEFRDRKPVVHLVRGKKRAEFYNSHWKTNRQAQVTKVHSEILTAVGDPARNLTVVFAETYDETDAKEGWSGHVAMGVGKPPEGGFALYSSWILKDEFTAQNREEQLKRFFDSTPIPGRKAFGSRKPNSQTFEFVEDAYGAVVHELGHALGLPHDYRSTKNIMGSGFRELRWNIDSRSPRNRRAIFSIDNARMLMASRYLASDAKMLDFDPPTVKFELTRHGKSLNATVSATDESGLKALVFYDRTKKVTSLVGGASLSGKSKKIVKRLPDELLKVGRTPKVEVFVADVGGNVTRVTKSVSSN